MVDADGSVQTAKKLGMGRATVERIAGGLEVRAGSIVLAEQGIASLDAEANRAP